jgi:tryptophan-rich sensory protein
MPGSVQRVWIARALAVAADIVQVALTPATVEGVFSPIADGLDLVMAAVLTVLVGWHLAFIPSFLVKLLPIGDLAPTWTMAVLVATRGRTKTPESHSEAPMPSLLPMEASASDQRWRPWYDALKKPAWTPTPATIGLIWTLLYPLIVFSFGFVFWEVFRGRMPGIVGVAFAINLAANLCFTPILFGLKNLPLATLDILVVAGTLVWGMVLVWPYYGHIGHIVAIAQVPYLVWVCIASILQVGILIMNRGSRN